MNIEVGSIVVMKKQHPCKLSNEFKILRIGIDIKKKCTGCNSVINISRENFDKKIKEIKE